MNALLLLGCILMSAAASIFLKLGATALGGNILSLLNNPMIWFGGFCYAAAFLGYIYVLRIVPLSLAQPVITVGVSVVTVFVAAIFLRETVALLNWVGLCFIAVGIFLLFWGRV